MTKIYHVHLLEPFNGKSDYYFSSRLAIYDVLTREVIGITYAALGNALRRFGAYQNNRCTVRVGNLISRTQRGKKEDARKFFEFVKKIEQ